MENIQFCLTNQTAKSSYKSLQKDTDKGWTSSYNLLGMDMDILVALI